jgi:peptidoglycan LD-endopeptidase LytH
MRSGLLGRWAAAAAAVTLAAGCAQSGEATRANASPSSATPSGEGSIPQQEQRPQGDDPVKVPPPKVSEYAYVFPVKDCRTTYQRKLLVLPKTTIWAAKGCAFVAPIDGVVDEVNIRNRWRPSTDRGADREGRFVTIVGEDGVRYLGGHLDSVTEGLAPGNRVKAGQELGRVGNSGNARDTAPNLYFAISWKTGPAHWWVRRGMIRPWDYLDAWSTGNKTLSPREATRKLRRKLGETPPCALQCASRKLPQGTKDPGKRPGKRSEPGPVLTVDPTVVPSVQP